jgi:hypothetical protein
MIDTGVVRAAVAPLLDEPSVRAEQVSQTLAGHRVAVLGEQDAWLRVRTRDAYEGWLHPGYLYDASDHTLAHRFRDGRVSLGCVVRERDGLRRALPPLAVLADDAVVEQGEALHPVALAARCARDARAVPLTAQRLFAGTAYQWGGITPWGADCSGLVQTCFALHGIALPRDARVQAEQGTAVTGGFDALLAGDLLFFSDRDDGRITHVALALAPRRIVHLALGRGGWAEERLDDDSDAYVRALARRLRSIRRIEGSGSRDQGSGTF